MGGTRTVEPAVSIAPPAAPRTPCSTARTGAGTGALGLSTTARAEARRRDGEPEVRVPAVSRRRAGGAASEAQAGGGGAASDAGAESAERLLGDGLHERCAGERATVPDLERGRRAESRSAGERGRFGVVGAAGDRRAGGDRTRARLSGADQRRQRTGVPKSGVGRLGVRARHWSSSSPGSPRRTRSSRATTARCATNS